MRALILWAEPASTNLGVQALARGCESLLGQAFAGATTANQGFGKGDAPVRVGDWRRQAWRVASRNDELVSWVRGFDLVVDTRGGDSFSDIYGLRRLATMGLMIEIAKRAKVPVVLSPQTIGPFDTRAGRVLARRTLRQAKLVFTRDSVSTSVARQLSGREPAQATDVVFALPPVVPDETTRDVVINPSGLLWSPSPHVDYLHYRRTVTELCSQLMAAGRRVSLLAHVLDSVLVDNDVTAVRELAADLGPACEVVIPSGLDDVRSILASARLVVGSRMHACLNALSVGRPAIALAYSRKFAPLLSDLGWNRTVDLRDPIDHVAAVRAAADDATLDHDVSLLRERADERIEFARQVLVRAF